MPRENGEQPKRGIRILGIDDSPFTKRDRRVLVVGVVWREKNPVEAVLSTYVQRDGSDSTKKVLEMVTRSRFRHEIKFVLINSIMLAGFNVVDIDRLCKELGVPVVAVVRRRPSMADVFKAVKLVSGWRRKVELIRKAGEVKEVAGLHVQMAGITSERAEKILRRFRGIPEPIRLAHVIASGIVRGESRGRA